MNPARDGLQPGDEILARFPRGRGEELRFMRQLFEGKPILQLRIWREAPHGWQATQKGTSIRRHELATLIGALTRAAESMPPASPPPPRHRPSPPPPRHQPEQQRDRWAPRWDERRRDPPRRAESDRGYFGDDELDESWK